MPAEKSPDDEILELIRREFPNAGPVSTVEARLLAAQLGKEPAGETFVACRCPQGRPAVILTLPLEGSGGSVPPLLWLTCPHAAAAVGSVESTGAARRLQSELKTNLAMRHAFEEDESRYSEIAVALANVSAGEVVASRMGGRGAAGGKAGNVKCLHAHLAFMLSIGGPADGTAGAAVGERAIVGRWTRDRMREEGGEWCEEIPSACVL